MILGCFRQLFFDVKRELFVALDAAGNGDGIAHLRWFIVDESVRAGGIGRRLLNEALEHADSTGVVATHLWVGNLNAPQAHFQT